MCPDGSVPENGVCPAPEANCPDGTRPSNGSCAASLSDCPDGSRPVNGYCMAQNGLCSDGRPPAAGQTCPATYSPCADGSQPVGGRCSPTLGACPNGSQPVNGKCPLGTSCDPVTDPNHCAGNENHAGGGQTCQAQPFCSGDEALCNILAQQWATRCAVEGLAPRNGPGEADYGPRFEAGQAWGQPVEGSDGSQLDGSGWLSGGGQCPALPTAEFMGRSFAMSEIVPCSALQILAVLILLAGYVQAAYILGRS